MAIDVDRKVLSSKLSELPISLMELAQQLIEQGGRVVAFEALTHPGHPDEVVCLTTVVKEASDAVEGKLEALEGRVEGLQANSRVPLPVPEGLDRGRAQDGPQRG